MTPDSIIILSPDARLDALLDLLRQAHTRAMQTRCEGDLDTWTLAWERLHDELMSQIDLPLIKSITSVVEIDRAELNKWKKEHDQDHS